MHITKSVNKWNGETNDKNESSNQGSLGRCIAFW